MEVKFLEACRAEGRSFEIGEVADLPESVARQLLAIGRAEHEVISAEDVAAYATAPAPEPAPAPRPAPRRASAKPAPQED